MLDVMTWRFRPVDLLGYGNGIANGLPRLKSKQKLKKVKQSSPLLAIWLEKASENQLESFITFYRSDKF